ncbi:MAG TPA: hypothetical protein VFL99_12990 [Segeticoccus sp.]|uniref:hypothetical protein n=1 Tax=Segeticoccus sp. TaxID=2706531 RepID=UPI002D807910|nr:hypothetical protein [Segeticoccus sp.]HET8601237.1 hypothetical protein [Segeticoccus sp.]
MNDVADVFAPVPPDEPVELDELVGLEEGDDDEVLAFAVLEWEDEALVPPLEQAAAASAVVARIDVIASFFVTSTVLLLSIERGRDALARCRSCRVGGEPPAFTVGAHA